MFVTYPIEATINNWVHESICFAFTTICNAINVAAVVPDWPDVLPAQHRDALSAREALQERLNAFSVEARKLSHAERTEFLNLIAQQNQIAGLLDGSVSVPVISEVLKPLVSAAKAVCDEGFSLLTKTGVRDAHYKTVWDSLKSKTCPFCGFEPFDAPTLRREDEDHYLARSIYPLAAANFLNLVPMGSKCNARYKGQKDILHLNEARRKAFNPYGNNRADISLLNSIPFGGPDDAPAWEIDLLPDSEEARTWENVFSIRPRLTQSVLTPYFFTWLSEIPDWFDVCQIDERIDNDGLLVHLEKFAAHKRKHKEAGPGFLKDKVVEMLVHHYKRGNKHLIAMIRSGLPKQAAA